MYASYPKGKRLPLDHHSPARLEGNIPGPQLTLKRDGLVPRLRSQAACCCQMKRNPFLCKRGKLGRPFMSLWPFRGRRFSEASKLRNALDSPALQPAALQLLRRVLLRNKVLSAAVYETIDAVGEIMITGREPVGYRMSWVTDGWFPKGKQADSKGGFLKKRTTPCQKLGRRLGRIVPIFVP